MSQKPYFFFENYINRMGESTSYEIFSNNFKKIFNFLIRESIYLPPDTDELIIPAATWEKYKDLNVSPIMNFNFNESYNLLISNYALYKTAVHPNILDQYHQHCQYQPLIQAFSEDDFNIAIHLRTVLPDDSWGDNDLKWSEFINKPSEAPYAEAYEFFNIDLTPTKNRAYYSGRYARLINNLVEYTSTVTNKPITVHIFSRGERKIFELLEVNLSPNVKLRFHLDTNAADVFFWLTKADILVCAKSSFSWLASFFNRGKSIMSYPYRHKLSPNCFYFEEFESKIIYFTEDSISH